MATVAELKEELREAKFQLHFAKQVTLGNANSGMLAYGYQLIKVERLQIELNKALAERG